MTCIKNICPMKNSHFHIQNIYFWKHHLIQLTIASKVLRFHIFIIKHLQPELCPAYLHNSFLALSEIKREN
ncbi:hypothetical protein CISIN_1g035218mg [Citrus sinensis]|uniref:Uncharacterized protein n=1 Tax=Citrus sinensis TaxID=2711 RepID=A0A067E2K7_CITSI|nr:hypothetical protein CISIN_1g035218mg [Citrus sinensis]KDO49460.1 hypothetical protein CISIN_1g035218mg [Citrus sinensis]